MHCKNIAHGITVPQIQAAGSLDSLYDLQQLAARMPEHSRMSVSQVGCDGSIRIKFKPASAWRRWRGRHGSGSDAPDTAALRQAIAQVIGCAMVEVQAHLPRLVLPDHLSVLDCAGQGQSRQGLPLFSPAHVQDVLQRAATCLTRELNPAFGKSAAIRDVRRTPAECLIDWITFLDCSKLPHTRFLLDQARQCWEQGWVTQASLRGLLQPLTLGDANTPGSACRHKAHTLLAQCQAVSTAAVCNPVRMAVPQEYCQSNDGSCPRNSDQFPYTQLNDNLYGRIFDSMLVDYLFRHVPVQACAATYIAASTVAGCLERMEPGQKVDVMAEFTSIACSEQRFWMKWGEAAQNRLLEYQLAPLRLAKVLGLLKKPPQDGVGVMLRHYMMARLMVAMRESCPSAVPWMRRSNINYLEIINVQSARINKTQLDMGIRTVRSGITLSYQPSLLARACRDASWRPVEYYKPDYQDPSTALKVALESGQPYASGVSGTTNLILHLAAHIKRRRALDMHHLWLSVLIFVVTDGGHSIHETLWVANQLDSVLGLDLEMTESANPLTYVGSVTQLERLFAATASAQLIADAKRYAWCRTQEAFRRYSHYAETDSAGAGSYGESGSDRRQ